MLANGPRGGHRRRWEGRDTSDYLMATRPAGGMMLAGRGVRYGWRGCVSCSHVGVRQPSRREGHALPRHCLPRDARGGRSTTGDRPFFVSP